MPGRGIEIFTIPDTFWQFPETIAALRERDIGKILVLAHQHTGAAQTQIGTACGKTQPKINALIRGTSHVRTLEVFEQYADAVDMPDHARILLGLATRAASRPAGETGGEFAFSRSTPRQGRCLAPPRPGWIPATVAKPSRQLSPPS